MERLFNPSPLGAAAPTNDSKNPFSLDISMSTCAVGKIAVKKARSEKLPEGWIIDKDGFSTADPAAFYDGGSILPIGGNVGYKGYGLAFLVDILSGVLSGNVAASSGDFRGGNGVFMFTLDVSRFGSVDLFKGRVGDTIRRVKTSKKAPGVKEIFILGEPEIIEAEKRLQSGIFVEESTWSELCSIAGGLGVSIPSQIVGDPQN